MNYYKHHIGDFAQATAHLTFVEDAAYSRLLRKYYAEEKPIPADLRKAQRLVGARTKEEKEAVETVLEEFFALEDDGWHNKRADEEIARAQERAETNRRVAEEREAKKRARSSNETTNNSETERDESGARNVHETCNESLPEREPSHKPLATSQDKPRPPSDEGGVPGGAGDPVSDCPQQAIIAAYHDELPMLPRVREWNEQRRKLLRSRWRESTERQDVDWWRTWFAWIRETCPFLVGQGTCPPGRDPFVADLEWLIRPNNFAKVVEGRYERREDAA